ncbi:hypothetical protein PVAP13_9NG852400 [Panicum virgatum]|uniref:F-box domain-containing protein n=1 Tax=Panicum virgatum TaxID=38727 RepID=A0A8T0MYY6_PANVG|nr:hypothetical protein PVAP13_9NG852400 [Panicum virgatum]
MKLRLRSMEARGGGRAAVETHRVDLPPTATLPYVKALLAAKLSAAQPVPAESVRLSLNRTEELVSPDPAATLPVVDATKGWSSFVLGDLKRETGNVAGAEETAAGRLVSALHAALLEVGFLTTDPMGSYLWLQQDWPSVASKPLAIKYTIPELSPMSPAAEEGKVAVLNFSLMGNFVIVYGYVPGAQSEVCRLCLELPRLEPLLYLDSDQLSGVQERAILDMWKVLKDDMCLPLMISLCQLNGLRLPPCLMALPAELKTKVLDLLPGDDLARVECTCKEMRNLAADDSLWEKFIAKYKTYGEGSRGAMSAKAMFGEAWLANKRRQKRPHPTFWNYGWGNNPYSRPLRQPLIGGDSDRLPFIGNHGSVGRNFGNQRRNIVPNCILDGHRHNFL